MEYERDKGSWKVTRDDKTEGKRKDKKAEHKKKGRKKKRGKYTKEELADFYSYPTYKETGPYKQKKLKRNKSLNTPVPIC